MILGGPIDWDWGDLASDGAELGLLVLAGLVALAVTAGLLLTIVTVVLTRLRGAPEDDADDDV